MTNYEVYSSFPTLEKLVQNAAELPLPFMAKASKNRRQLSEPFEDIEAFRKDLLTSHAKKEGAATEPKVDREGNVVFQNEEEKHRFKYRFMEYLNMEADGVRNLRLFDPQESPELDMQVLLDLEPLFAAPETDSRSLEAGQILGSVSGIEQILEALEEKGEAQPEFLVPLARNLKFLAPHAQQIDDKRIKILETLGEEDPARRDALAETFSEEKEIDFCPICIQKLPNVSISPRLFSPISWMFC